MSSLSDFNSNGYAIVEQCLLREEIDRIIELLGKYASASGAASYAIRRVLAEIPELVDVLAKSAVVPLLTNALGDSWFAVKSILFDKPVHSDWIVNRHQDAIINTTTQADIPGFTAWKKRPWGYSVQPPGEYLESITTMRIHLDDTDETNGALKVLPGTHRHGILGAEAIRAAEYNREELCAVRAGGVLLMKPLLVHASAKNTSGCPRRVIHIECTPRELPPPLHWDERIRIF